MSRFLICISKLNYHCFMKLYSSLISFLNWGNAHWKFIRKYLTNHCTSFPIFVCPTGRHSSLFLYLWRRRQHVPPKHWCQSTGLHSIKTQKTNPHLSNTIPCMALKPLLGLGLPQKAPHSSPSPAHVLHPCIRRMHNASLWMTSSYLSLGFPTHSVLWNFQLKIFFWDPFIFQSYTTHPP